MQRATHVGFVRRSVLTDCGNLGGPPFTLGHNSSTFVVYVFRSLDCKGEVRSLGRGESAKMTIRSYRIA